MVQRRGLVLLVIMMMVMALPAMAQRPTQVEVWSSSGWALEGATAGAWGMRAVVDLFHELNPDIELIWNSQEAGAGQTPEAMAKLMTAIVAGTPPDVTVLDRFLAAGWAARGAIQTLDEYAKDSTILREENFASAVWEEMHSIDGELYAVTEVVGAVGYWSLYYNKDLFAEAGLDPNTPRAPGMRLLNLPRR